MDDIEFVGPENPDQNVESTDQKDKPEDTGNSAPTVEDAGTQSETTANCAGDTFDYKEGNPIVSITFSLSKENPFEVNVGASMTSYKKSDKKAYPVLCEIRDFTTESKVKIEPLKNKGCIEKNLPKVLAPILTQLNSLLLDQYTMYYDTKKYDDFVAAQSEFLKAPTQTPAEKGKDEGEGEEEKQEQEQEQEQEPQLTPEQEKRKLDLNEKVLGVVREGAKQINEKDKDLIDKIKNISEQNRIGKVLQDFLANELQTNPTRYLEMFPLHLLNYKYQDNDVQQLFMTNNGIITNGNVIFSYLNVDKQNKAISANTGGEFSMWTLKNEYQKALAALNGTQKDEGYIPDKLINEGFPQKGGLGTRRTLSKKLFKKRTTRRSRK
jgi:hypothetical protein